MPDYDDIEGGLLDDEEWEALLGLPDEWFAKYEDRFYGYFYAYVVENNDPNKFHRVKVECPEIYGYGLESPWCEPSGMLGADRSSGLVWVPRKNAVVTIWFKYGDPDYPVYSYGPWFVEKEGLPGHGQGEADETDTANPKGLGVGFIPASTADPEYPLWRGLKTPEGHMLEFDGTEGKERTQLFHKNGGHLEFLQNGDAHLGTMGNVKQGAFGGEWRAAAIDETGQVTGTEVGMSPTGGTYGPHGWLGKKSACTPAAGQPLICGTLLVSYLESLHGLVIALSEALSLDPGVSPATITAAEALANGLPILEATYFTPSPTSFLSDYWYTQKSTDPTPEE